MWLSNTLEFTHSWRSVMASFQRTSIEAIRSLCRPQKNQLHKKKSFIEIIEVFPNAGINSAAHLVGLFAALLVQFYQLVLARAGLDTQVEAEIGLD